MRAVILGATGMVGGAVLRECIASDAVREIVAIGRRPAGLSGPKVREVIHADFTDFTAVRSEFSGAVACFYCVGAYINRLSREEYFRVTVDCLAACAAQAARAGPGPRFCLFSAQGASRSERSPFAFPLAKGRAENALIRSGVREYYMFRPGYIRPPAGVPEPVWWYWLGRWAYRALPPIGIDVADLARVMVHVGLNGHGHDTLENGQMRRLAAQLRPRA